MIEPEQLISDLAAIVPTSSFKLDARTAFDRLQSLKIYTSAIPFTGEEALFWDTFWFLNQQTPERLSQLYGDLSTADGNLAPHQAFLLAVLQLLETPTALLNTLPARHRSLFYHDLLGLRARAPGADSVLLSIALRNNASHFLLPAGTLFDAGQDSAGHVLHYATDADLLLNHQQFSKLCWTRFDELSQQLLLCTALDVEKNIKLAEAGVRLFSELDNEQAWENETQLQFHNFVLPPGNIEIVLNQDVPDASSRAVELQILRDDQWIPLQSDSVNATSHRFSLLNRNERQHAPPPQLRTITPADAPPLTIASVTINVSDSLQLRYSTENGAGRLDLFSYPFGVAPVTGCGFEITLPPELCTTGGTLMLEPQWRDLPEQGFPTWYQHYPQPPESNAAFLVQGWLISPQGRVVCGEPQPLFGGDTQPIGQPLTLILPAGCDASTLRIELCDSDFAHADYQRNPAGKNPPWTPQVSRFITHFSLQLDGKYFTQNALRQPFAEASDRQVLFLGFTDCAPGDTLSLYWSLDAPTPLPMNWFYYSDTQRWLPMDAAIDDATGQLFNSGLWRAILPEDIGTDSELFPGEGYWIKGVPLDEIAVEETPRLESVIASAVTATLINSNDIAADHFIQPLAANSISQLVLPNAAISSVSQPLQSWNGVLEESEDDFYARAAKRLAHRHRAVTWGDMRTLLIDQYPQIMDVKTPSAERLTRIPAPERQQLVIIPDNRYPDNDDALRPQLSNGRLAEMEQWLSQIASPWASPQIINPVYIDVIADYTVLFQSGVNPDYGYSQLAQLLEKKFTPWSSDLQQGVKPGNKVDYYQLLATLQNSPLVGRVQTLSLRRSENDETDQTLTAADNEVLILRSVFSSHSQTGENNVQN
ncbi:hypothetical protein [Erwinia oleae]|uniref:hypothetical protein n=1 Tax=Erwinia oleae TaxID=796334 RepID=UPI000557CB15|nr:hypothetical protein [Erwinia oleae]